MGRSKKWAIGINYKIAMTKKSEVILSTFGPLHLVKSAEYLSRLVDIRLIQGWIPAWWNKWLLVIADRILGYKLSKTIKKRTPQCLTGRNIGIGIPEFYAWIARMYLRDRLSSVKAAIMYGKLSRKYIKKADIFHVRSGSGLGGAIEKAQKEAMKVIVDHSIAHPAFMSKSLKDEFERNGEHFDLGEESPFWQYVLSDCRKADVLLVNSNFVKETFVQQGFDASKIAVIYLGVREDFWGLKKSYVLSKPIKLLFTGSFGFRKGGEYLLKALCLLEKRGIECELIIVGGYSGGKTLLEKYPSKNIRLTGVIPQDEMKVYLQHADLYVFPSLCEGCAQSGMEALAAGLPVIATYESGLPIEDGVNGLIIKSKDEKAIVDAILRLVGDDRLRERIGKTAMERMKDYTWDKYASNVVDLYTKLLEMPVENV